MQPVSKQQLGKHVPAKMNMRNNGRTVFFIMISAMQRGDKRVLSAIVAVFSASSVPMSYLEDNWHYSVVEGSI
jgi:hypothetical protein